MKLKPLLASCLLTLCSASHALPASAGPDTATATSDARAVAPSGVSPGSAEDERRYAALEAASPEAKAYRGGDVVVISATAVAIGLLVVIVLILL